LDLAENLGCGREEDEVVKGTGLPDMTFFRVVGTIILSRDSIGGGLEDCQEKYERVAEMVDEFWTDAGFAKIPAEFEVRKKEWEARS
jgi:hypothetical protein